MTSADCVDIATTSQLPIRHPERSEGSMRTSVISYAHPRILRVVQNDNCGNNHLRFHAHRVATCVECGDDREDSAEICRQILRHPSPPSLSICHPERSEGSTSPHTISSSYPWILRVVQNDNSNISGFIRLSLRDRMRRHKVGRREWRSHLELGLDAPYKHPLKA